jgi:hypothetical protein
VKELKLKLGECGKDFPNKDGQHIELILMNLKTLHDVLCLTFHASWDSQKEDHKDCSLYSFYGFLIRA